MCLNNYKLRLVKPHRNSSENYELADQTGWCVISCYDHLFVLHYEQTSNNRFFSEATLANTLANVLHRKLLR
jgi:hypothetical protein